jgi:tetratricopeptide (TPR) repeat protein
VLLDRTVEVANELGEPGLAARALVLVSNMRLGAAPEVGAAEMVPVAEQAIRTLEALGDPLGLAEAGKLLAEALARSGRFAESFVATDRAVVQARDAGAAGIRRQLIGWLANSICESPMPVEEGIARLEELCDSNRDDPVLKAVIERQLAYALAMTGRLDEARASLEASGPILDEVNEMAATWGPSRFRVSQTLELMGDAAGAEQDLIAQWRHFQTTRARRSSSLALNAAAQLALLRCDQGRWDEAVECLIYGEEVDQLPAPQGKTFAFFRLAARARIAAHDGRHEEALDLARPALDLARMRGAPNLEARVWLALAEVQRASGNQPEADEAGRRALDLYDAKGNVAAAARVRVAI